MDEENKVKSVGVYGRELKARDGWGIGTVDKEKKVV